MPPATFDRIAPWYDQTRTLDPDEASRPIHALARRFPSRRFPRLLEVGVGTGRFASMMVREGYRVVGVDLSQGMLTQLRERLRSEPGLAIDPIRGDALHLPFPDGSFDGVYWVHVLHLVPGWRAALDECLRVVRPGGFLLSGKTEGGPDLRRISDRYDRLAFPRGRGPGHPGVRRPETIVRFLRQRGARALSPPLRREWTEPVTVREALHYLNLRVYSRMRAVPLRTHRSVMRSLRAWALSQYGSMDAADSVPASVRLQIFVVPPAKRGRRARRNGAARARKNP